MKKNNHLKKIICEYNADKETFLVNISVTIDGKDLDIPSTTYVKDVKALMIERALANGLPIEDYSLNKLAFMALTVHSDTVTKTGKIDNLLGYEVIYKNIPNEKP